jgi:hypothetical protein
MRVVVIGSPKQFEILDTYLGNVTGIDGQRYAVRQTPADPKEVLDGIRQGTDQYEIAIVYNAGTEIVSEIARAVPVTIVLTALGSFDECVQVMREGAWDYIELAATEEKSPLDRLLESMREGCEARRLTDAADDVAWVLKNMHQLIIDRRGEWIAVRDGAVVKHARGYGALLRSLSDDESTALIWRVPDVVKMKVSEG